MGAEPVKIKITAACCCEHDLHEITNYPRQGLTLQQFKAGDELEVKNEWTNCYGSYYRCQTAKGYADILTTKAEPIE